MICEFNLICREKIWFSIFCVCSKQLNLCSRFAEWGTWKWMRAKIWEISDFRLSIWNFWMNFLIFVNWVFLFKFQTKVKIMFLKYLSPFILYNDIPFGKGFANNYKKVFFIDFSIKFSKSLKRIKTLFSNFSKSSTTKNITNTNERHKWLLDFRPNIKVVIINSI
jgi:hypothetical protein